jgi:hypothetical protein
MCVPINNNTTGVTSVEGTGNPKGRQYNIQMKKNKRINNAIQNTTQKIKD